MKNKNYEPESKEHGFTQAATKLTKSQHRVFSCVTQFIYKNQYPPTVQQIADMQGISIHAVHDQLVRLRRKGFISGAGREMKVTCARVTVEFV